MASTSLGLTQPNHLVLVTPGSKLVGGCPPLSNHSPPLLLLLPPWCPTILLIFFHCIPPFFPSPGSQRLTDHQGEKEAFDTSSQATWDLLHTYKLLQGCLRLCIQGKVWKLQNPIGAFGWVTVHMEKTDTSFPLEQAVVCPHISLGPRFCTIQALFWCTCIRQVISVTNRQPPPNYFWKIFIILKPSLQRNRSGIQMKMQCKEKTDKTKPSA